MPRTDQTLEEALADFQHFADGQWVPAANGTEVPTKYQSGHTLLYCYNPLLRKHAFLNCETDTMVEGAELESILNWPYILPQGSRIDYRKDK